MRLLSFPDYDTPIGTEIGRALRGERDYGAGRDAAALRRQPLRVEDRRSSRERDAGAILDLRSLSRVERRLRRGPGPRRRLAGRDPAVPAAAGLTFLLDIPPDVSARRKTADRDKYERDLALLGACQRELPAAGGDGGWVRLDADRDRAEVGKNVFDAVSARL